MPTPHLLVFVFIKKEQPVVFSHRQHTAWLRFSTNDSYFLQQFIR